MKAYNTSFLLDAKFVKKKIENPNFDQKLFLPRPNLYKNSQKMFNIFGNTKPISTNEVSNESI